MRHVLEAIRALVAQGVDLGTAVDRWLERWLRRMRERVGSGERSAGYVAELERRCAPDGHIGIRWAQPGVHEIDYAGLGEWMAWLASKRKLSPKTRWNIVAAMSAFLGWLRKVGEITPAIPWSKTSLRRVWKAACTATGVEISLYEGIENGPFKTPAGSRFPPGQAHATLRSRYPDPAPASAGS